MRPVHQAALSRFTRALLGVCNPRSGALLSWLALASCTDPTYGRGLDRPVGAEEAGVRAEPVPDARIVEPSQPDGGPSSVRGVELDAGPGSRSERDAEPPLPEPDAGPTTESFPSWAEALPGTYASLSHAYAEDSFLQVPVMSRHSTLSFVRIVREGSRATMTSKLCRFDAEADSDVLSMVDPSNLPEISRTVLFHDDQTFSTDAQPSALGYRRELPAECTGKASQAIPKLPHQAWLERECRCPRAFDDMPRSDDCRVLDPDRDGKPGLTYVDKLKDLTAVIPEIKVYAVSLTRSHPFRVRVDPQGKHHSGQFTVDEVAYHFECSEGDNCVQYGTATPCETRENSIDFLRLEGDGWDCARLLQMRPGFPKAAVTPGSCNKGKLTDLPTP